MNRIERIEYTRNELLAQPTALQQTLSSTCTAAKSIVASLAGESIQNIYLVGSGDSFMVGEAVAYSWQSWLKTPVVAMQALEYARFAADSTTTRKTLVVVVSASGGSWATEEALKAATDRHAITLGVTGQAKSPLTERTTHHLLVQATRIGWPTQSSTAQIAALLQLGLIWSGREDTLDARAVNELPNIVQQVIDDQDMQMLTLAEQWVNHTLFFFAGSGSAYAAARMGAAKIKEMSQDHAFAMYLEEYHHYYSVKKGEAFFLLCPDGPSRDRALETARIAAADDTDLIILHSQEDQQFDSFHAKSIALPSVPEFVTSVVYAIPLQLFSQHLAILKRQPGWVNQNHQGRPTGRAS